MNRCQRRGLRKLARRIVVLPCEILHVLGDSLPRQAVRHDQAIEFASEFGGKCMGDDLGVRSHNELSVGHRQFEINALLAVAVKAIAQRFRFGFDGQLVRQKLLRGRRERTQMRDVMRLLNGVQIFVFRLVNYGQSHGNLMRLPRYLRLPRG